MPSKSIYASESAAGSNKIVANPASGDPGAGLTSFSIRLRFPPLPASQRSAAIARRQDDEQEPRSCAGEASAACGHIFTGGTTFPASWSTCSVPCPSSATRTVPRSSRSAIRWFGSRPASCLPTRSPGTCSAARLCGGRGRGVLSRRRRTGRQEPRGLKTSLMNVREASWMRGGNTWPVSTYRGAGTTGETRSCTGPSCGLAYRHSTNRGHGCPRVRCVPGSGLWRHTNRRKPAVGCLVGRFTRPGQRGRVRRPTSAFLYVYVADVDATFQHAVEEGARVIEAPLDTPYGDRRCIVEDPGGNTWASGQVRGVTRI